MVSVIVRVALTRPKKEIAIFAKKIVFDILEFVINHLFEVFEAQLRSFFVLVEWSFIGNGEHLFEI